MSDYLSTCISVGDTNLIIFGVWDMNCHACYVKVPNDGKGSSKCFVWLISSKFEIKQLSILGLNVKKGHTKIRYW